MTAFLNIYSDLPSRAHEIWQRTKGPKERDHRDLSVTAMLMAAAAGLAMPWESLKDKGSGNRKNWDDHPSFQGGDQASYKNALKAIDRFCDKRLSDCLHQEESTLYHCPKLGGIRHTVEQDGDSSTRLKLEDCTVRCAIKIIRNALSHNNIFALGSDLNEIEKLGFFSENRVGHGCQSTVDGWHVLVTSVGAFEKFLQTWFALLQTKNSCVPVGAKPAGENCPVAPQ